MPLERSLFTQEELISFVRACYGLKITSVRRLPLGSANCFCLMGETKRYFLKEFQSGITPQSVAAEAALLEILATRGIPVARTLPGLDGAFVTVYGGHAVCLQEFVEGQTYGYDDFPDHLLPSLAHTLGRLHTAMRDIGMPSPRDANIAASYRAADSAVQYEQLLMDAERIREDPEYARIVEELKYKRELAYRCDRYRQYYEGITYCPTHGDFQGCQTVWQGDRLRAVIDFSAARVLPAVWEVMRSYVQSSAQCRATAVIDVAGFRDYVREYLRVSPLTGRDLRAMPYVYLFQLARSRFGYPQYMQTDSPDRVGLLQFAHWRTAMCRQVESRAEEIVEAMADL
jgi:Ser/Thr protein kinase RdoA (MazF antagonist)